MKNAISAQIVSVTFIFITKLIFTLFPNILFGNEAIAKLNSLLILAANAIPIWFFLELKKELLKEIDIKPVIDLILFCLFLKLINRLLITTLHLGVSTLFIERLLYQFRFVVPILFYNCMIFFFIQVRKRSIHTRFGELKNTCQVNEIGFGLLALMTAVGLIDHLTGGNIYTAMSLGLTSIRMLSFLVTIFVYYASIRFYLGILKLTGEVN